jgi:Flp pilus assembly protein TadB
MPGLEVLGLILLALGVLVLAVGLLRPRGQAQERRAPLRVDVQSLLGSPLIPAVIGAVVAALIGGLPLGLLGAVVGGGAAWMARMRQERARIARVEAQLLRALEGWSLEMETLVRENTLTARIREAARSNRLPPGLRAELKSLLAILEVAVLGAGEVRQLQAETKTPLVRDFLVLLLSLAGQGGQEGARRVQEFLRQENARRRTIQQVRASTERVRMSLLAVMCLVALTAIGMVGISPEIRAILTGSMRGWLVMLIIFAFMGTGIALAMRMSSVEVYSFPPRAD